jgi:hypothetical protein
MKQSKGMLFLVYASDDTHQIDLRFVNVSTLWRIQSFSRDCPQTPQLVFVYLTRIVFADRGRELNGVADIGAVPGRDDEGRWAKQSAYG